MKIKNKKFKKLLFSIIILQNIIIATSFSFREIEVEALDKENYLSFENQTKDKKENTTEDEIIEDVVIYTQSPQLFEEDNLNFRGDSKKISFKGDYYSYDYYSDDSVYYPIIFVGEKIQEDFNIKSGDKISFYSTNYTVIDNQSNCNNFTDDYCVEILSEKQFLDIQKINFKKQ